ncbi:MAG: tetratricopeptide repeat protein, partial [Methanosarcinaceae archaeon]|nr:tetratricopeptide repeat protein [Methanosarcinaceae archaeon]
MEDSLIKELIETVVEHLNSEEGSLNDAVSLAINFSTTNSIPSDILLTLCNSYGSNGAYEPAYVFAKAAASLATGNMKAVAHYGAGIASYLLGLITEAEEQYKKALEIDPKHLNTHSNYGNLLKQMGRQKEAEEQYKKALEIDPKHLNTHYNYGNLLMEMGRQKEAEEQYKKALEIDPNDADTHYNYGNLLMEMGRQKEAEEQYKK